jgi:dihydrofolate reductase
MKPQMIPVRDRELDLIVAMNHKRVIGRDGGIPWHCSEDMKRFKYLTMGHSIIMGRRTHESIKSSLLGRICIIVSSQPAPKNVGGTWVESLSEALAVAYLYDDRPLVIGGARIYEEALPLVTTVWMTVVDDTQDGDTYFPAFNGDDFRVVDSRRVNGATFSALQRIRRHGTEGVDR